MKVLIAEDHPLIANSYQSLLSTLISNVSFTVVETLAQGLNVVKDGEIFDIALLDISLNGVHSYPLIEKIRLESPDTLIISVSAFDDQETVETAMGKGAMGFISKRYSVDLALDEIKAVIGDKIDLNVANADKPLSEGNEAAEPALQLHRKPLQWQISQNSTMESRKKRRAIESNMEKLTRRERQMAALLIEGKSNEEIGKALFLSTGTIKNYMSYLFAKLNVSSRTQAVLKLTEAADDSS